MNKNLEYHAQTSEQFSQAMLAWFAYAKRDLAFRATKDPYCIWISEIMAQQTQIDTLLPYYQRFIKMFPNVTTLAQAPEHQVLKLWEGLGYYSRAKNLHKAAKVICDDYNGHFPNTYAELVKLPGIGPYTAGAIASIAFKEKVPAIDGNVLRVVSRFNNYSGDIAEPKTKKVITEWVQQTLPDEPGDFNESLMELGALICTPKSPKCMICPVQSLCQSHKAGTADTLPVKSKKIRQKRIKTEVGILVSKNQIFLVKRPSEGLLANLWGFPIIEETKGMPGQAIHHYLSEYFPGINQGEVIGKNRHVFTHIIWEMTIYRFNLSNETPISIHSDQIQMVDLEALDQYALPVAFSKLLKLL